MYLTMFIITKFVASIAETSKSYSDIHLDNMQLFFQAVKIFLLLAIFVDFCS